MNNKSDRIFTSRGPVGFIGINRHSRRLTDPSHVFIIVITLSLDGIKNNIC
jgi:hypothetical protein